MSDPDDPFAPGWPMKLAASNRRPAKKAKADKPKLKALPSQLASPRLPPAAPKSPIDGDPFEDDPFAQSDPFEEAAAAATPKRVPIGKPLPAPETHVLGDPFTAALTLPFIAVGLQRVWQRHCYVMVIDVLEITTGSPTSIQRFGADQAAEGLAVAACTAVSRGLPLIDGIHVESTISALVAGIHAGMAWQRAQRGSA